LAASFHQLKLVANGVSAKADNRAIAAEIRKRVIFRCDTP
jgi:hypothetical protein